MTERRGMTGQPVPRGMASWSWVPPAVTGRQVEGTGLLPLGRYEMPDGSQQVSFGLPQGLLDAYRSVRYGLGYEQDPNAPKGYTSFDAMNRGAFGAAGGAITGALGAGAARAIKSGMPRHVVSSGGAQKTQTVASDYFPQPSFQALVEKFAANPDMHAAVRRALGDAGEDITAVGQVGPATVQGYHGTRHSFDAFDPNRAKALSKRVDAGGVSATTRPDSADYYAGTQQYPESAFVDGSRIIPLDMKFKNPLVLRRQYGGDAGENVALRRIAEENGYDGIIFAQPDGHMETLAWSPGTVKSRLTGRNMLRDRQQ